PVSAAGRGVKRRIDRGGVNGRTLDRGPVATGPQEPGEVNAPLDLAEGGGRRVGDRRDEVQLCDAVEDGLGHGVSSWDAKHPPCRGRVVVSGWAPRCGAVGYWSGSDSMSVSVGSSPAGGTGCQPRVASTRAVDSGTSTVPIAGWRTVTSLVIMMPPGS